MTYHVAWSDTLVAALAEPFPPECVQQKEMRSKKAGTTSSISFVAWHHYVRKLNTLLGPGWSMGTPILHPIGSGEDAKLVMGIPITILGVTRINFGSEDEDKDDFGDAATNAFSQALKRTCALFGMGLDMYLKPNQKAAAQRSIQPEQAPSFKQMELIEKLKKSHVFTDDERDHATEWIKRYNTKKDAGALIDRLQKTINERLQAEQTA